MLRRLFKGRSPLRHPDPGVRCSAIRELGEAEAERLAADLAQLLRDDPDHDVRLACLAHVRDRRLLESLQQDPVLGEGAAQRLRALEHGGPGVPAASTAGETGHSRPTGMPERGAATGPAPCPMTADDLLALPPDAAKAKLEGLDDVQTLLELVLKARGELRQATLDHPALQSAAALTQLEKRSRGHDKTVNRHARRGLDRIRHLHAEAAGLQGRAEELAAALERTSSTLQDRAWRERQHQLHERLNATLTAYQALAEQLAEVGDSLPDLTPLRPDPADLPDLEPEPPAPEVPPTGAAPASAPDAAMAPGAAVPDDAAPVDAEDLAVSGDADPFAPLVDGFRELDRALLEGRPFAELAERRQGLARRWLTAADHRPPAEAQHQVFEAVSHRFRELADAMERLQQADLPERPEAPLVTEVPEEAGAHRGHWEAVDRHRTLHKRLEHVRRRVRWPDWAPPTTEYAALLVAIDDLKGELAQADAVLATELTRLDDLLSGLAAAVDEGSLNRARTLLAKARTLHDGLPAAAVRSHGKRLGKEAARLAELKDWQTFATAPKRESLVEAIESLAQAPLAPPEQAERIRELRREWQALGPVTQAADGRLADRFNAAAEKAFEPCRAYFAEQAELRRHNLEERRRICDQLERYLADTDWARADMKAAERIMRAARDEWRRFHPVERNPGRAVESRFEALQEQLHDRVKAAWNNNLATKERIVAEAEGLLGADLALPEKIETVKRLQRQWREVGITPRRPDQRLWRAFRAACDGVFAAREASRQAADAEQQALESRVAAELDAFAGALDAVVPGEPPPDAGPLRALGRDLDRLPPGRRRPLAERRGELMERRAALQAERARAGRRARLNALRSWDESMAAWEAAGCRGGPPQPPDGATALLQERLDAAGHEPPLDAARRLTVRVELAAGCDARPEDESLRLEIQVERLQAGLSGGGAAAVDDALSLMEAWCGLGPKTAEFAPLRDRFFAAVLSLR